MMDTQVVKRALHQIIDQIEDDESLNLCVKLLEREIRRNTMQDVFSGAEADLIARAQLSLQSVVEGKTRPIEDFRQDIEWKSRQITQ